MFVLKDSITQMKILFVNYVITNVRLAYPKISVKIVQKNIIYLIINVYLAKSIAKLAWIKIYAKPVYQATNYQIQHVLILIV